MSVTVHPPPPRSLDDVRDPDGDTSYPRDVLTGQSALILFAAAWHGRQDAVHVADAGLVGTCVDLDRRRLKEMRAVYPDGWQFVEADVFSFTYDAYEAGHVWDVVSLDPHTGLFDRCADLVDRWCLLARRVVVLGSGEFTVVEAPAKWRVSDRRKRSDFRGGIYWTVLERQ